MAAFGYLAGCAGPRQTVEEPPPVEAEVEVVEEDPIAAAGKRYKSDIDDGIDILAELSEPILPIYMSRTAGELTQVTYTDVGGDNSVDASSAEDLLVFSSDRHGKDHNIYVKSPTGKTVTQKTFEPFDEIQPAFSPDGRRIAYASNKNGNFDIWIIDTDTNGAAVQVTFGGADELHPSWTPEGDWLVYSAFSSRSGEWDIMMTSVNTGTVKELGRGKFPRVSPDGSRILFQRSRRRDGFWYSIWTMNMDGANQTEVISSADWGAINPSWSPDGQFIAFAAVHKSPEAKLTARFWRGDDIYVVRANGRGLIQVTDDTEPAWEPCWSIRDGRIYFISERNGFRNIWSIKPPVFTVASAQTPDEKTQ
jgi:TolB protein